ncbi:MAG: hypothetical protein HC772_17480, partial [Leptolyngbyaceae cyanobacterium CRU_2_3]|nr:hypothetical protein [Leptolyngbyaceae cyanobacterium CRU_2_3]
MRALDLKAGIVVVVAGREAPRWERAATAKPKTEIPAKFLLAKSIGHLATGDAMVYLQRVGIRDLALMESLIAYASV